MFTGHSGLHRTSYWGRYAEGQFPIPFVLPELAEQILLRISYATLAVNLVSEDSQSSLVSLLLALESLDLVEFALYVVLRILNVGLE